VDILMSCLLQLPRKVSAGVTMRAIAEVM